MARQDLAVDGVLGSLILCGVNGHSIEEGGPKSNKNDLLTIMLTLGGVSIKDAFTK